MNVVDSLARRYRQNTLNRDSVHPTSAYLYDLPPDAGKSNAEARAVVSVDGEKQPAASQELSATGLRPQDPLRLQEAYEAYLVFCELGSHRTAWRNLTVSLVSYMELYLFKCPDGTLRTPTYRPDAHRTRCEYLTVLGTEQLGYLTQDILWVLFRITAFIESDSELDKISGLGKQTRQHFRTLPLPDFQLLLVDITCELNTRTLKQTSIEVASTKWNPILGTEHGILAHLYVNSSPGSGSGRRNKKDSRGVDAKPAFYDLPKKLLRRAFSIGSGGQSKKLLDIKTPTDGSPFGNIQLDHFPQAAKDTPKVSPPVHTENSPSWFDTAKANGPRAAATSTPQPRPQFKTDMLWRHLNPIPEHDDECEDRSQGGDRESILSNTASVATSHTLDSLLDFYNQSYSSRNASSRTLFDPSKRASIDVGELSRPEFQELLSQARRLFDDVSSIALNEEGSNKSTFSGHDSYITARTRLSVQRTSRLTKKSSIDSFTSLGTTPSLTQEIVERTAYWDMIKRHHLLPQPMTETNWSDRGQHVEFDPEERDQIPLQVEKLLGKTRNALVESVRCKRVRLVRKLMRCNKWTGLKREDALREVQHLYRTQHSHIVRLVGTYVIGQDLAILTYPCAEWNLEQFMELTRTNGAALECTSLRRFFTCLAKVLDFMHSYPLKHMDIKPQNLLVRDIRNSPVNDTDPFKIYFTDFGISRSYDSAEEAETENPTSFTRTYAAFEVVMQESRGLSADVFSLGCVFTEMLATLLDASAFQETATVSANPAYWHALRAVRQKVDIGLRPYHSANESIRTWLSELPIEEPELHTVRSRTIEMLDTEPTKRPTAREIAEDPHLPFACLSCTLRTGSEDFEAAEPATPLHPPPDPSRASIEVPKLP
jgi:serine/threonine protein kinase